LTRSNALPYCVCIASKLQSETKLNKGKQMKIEVTKEAAVKLIGDDSKTWRDFTQTELAETTLYHGHGVNITVIYNYIGAITQYYITDINA